MMRLLMIAGIASLLVGGSRSATAQIPRRPDAGTKANDSPPKTDENGPVQPTQEDIDRVWKATATSVNNKLKELRGIVGASDLTGPVIIGGNVGKASPGGYDGDGGRKLLGLLKNSEPLQEELKMTAKQKEALKRSEAEFLKGLDVLYAREEFRDLAKKPEETRQALQARRSEEATALRRAYNRAAGELLSARQLERLDQIALQIRGPLAVGEPGIAASIGLEDDQIAEVKAIIDEMIVKQKEILRLAFTSPDDPDDSSTYRALPPDPRTPKIAEKKVVPDGKTKGEAGTEVAVARPPYKVDLATRMEWSTSRLEARRNEAILKIGKRLGQLQKIGFNQLLGRRIEDLSVLVPDSYMNKPARRPSVAGK